MIDNEFIWEQIRELLNRNNIELIIVEGFLFLMKDKKMVDKIKIYDGIEKITLVERKKQ
jgi:hypothetical protein